MFDLSRLRLLHFDQLHAWSVYRLRRELETASGERCAAGTEFRFDFAVVDAVASRAEIHGQMADGQSVVFATRDGDHRDCFEPTGREERPPAKPPVEQHQTAARTWGSTREDAEVLRNAALRLEHSQPAVARRIATEALQLYHAWMAQATSGGEGAAMEYEVRSELREMRRIEQGSQTE